MLLEPSPHVKRVKSQRSAEGGGLMRYGLIAAA